MEKERILELFLELLARAKKSVPLYPPGSHAVREWLHRLHQSIPQLIASGLRFPLRFEPHHVRSGELALLTIDPILDGLRFDLLTRGIEEVTIDGAVEEREVMAFLNLVNMDPFAIQEAGGPQAVLSTQGVTHIVVREISLAPGADLAEKKDWRTLPPEEQTQLLVDQVLRAFSAHLRALSLNRVGLTRWLEAVGEGDRPDRIYGALRTVAGLVASEREPALFLRTIVEALWGIPESCQVGLLRDWLVPRISQDVEALNLLNHFSEDELQRLAEIVPEDVLLGVVAALGELPGEDVPRKQLMESIGQRLRDERAGVRPVAPPEMDEGTLTRLRQGILASFQSDGLLETGTRILLAVLFHAENDEYPASVAEALEENLGVALSRGRLDLALGILTGMRSGAVRGEWFRDHNQRSVALLRLAADQTHVGLLVGCLKDHRTAEHAELTAQYLRLVGDPGIREFAAQLAEEQSRPVRAFMCHVLVRVGRLAVPALRLLIEDRRWYVVRNAVAVLGRIQDPSALPSISHVAKHPDPRVRKEVVRVLAHWGDGENIVPVFALLDDPDPEVIVTTIKELGRLRVEEAVHRLEAFALGHTDRRVGLPIREEAVRSLATMKLKTAREAIRVIAHRRLWIWQRQERQLRGLAARAARGEAIA